MAPEIERDPNLDEGKLAPNRLSRMGNYLIGLNHRRTAAGLAVATCALGMWGGLANTAKGEKSANSLAPMELVGVSTNDLFTADADAANQAAQEIEDLNANAVRIFYPVNEGTAWENYHDELCNAAKAAQSHNLQFMVSLYGVDKHGKKGFYPRTKPEIKQFVTTAASILWTVGSKNGCAPNMKRFIFDVNEPNYYVFNHNQGVNTAAQTIALDSALATTLKQDAAKPEINASVLFADAPAEGKNNSVGFVQAQCDAMKVAGLKNFYDLILPHPYPATSITDSPVATQNRIFSADKPLMASCFAGAQFGFGEWDVNTIPPPPQASRYSPPVSANVGVSEATQVKYIHDFLTTAQADGARVVTFFGLGDAGGGPMPSAGFIYKRVAGSPDQKKSSWAPVQNMVGTYTGR